MPINRWKNKKNKSKEILTIKKAIFERYGVNERKSKKYTRYLNVSESINNRSIIKEITAIKQKGKRNWDKKITSIDGNNYKQSKEKRKDINKE